MISLSPFKASFKPSRLASICAHSRSLLASVVVALFLGPAFSLAATPRHESPLLEGWRTTVSEDPEAQIEGFAAPGFDDSTWKTVDVPHNWDGYEGFRQVKHGDLHGVAWYRNTFTLNPADAGREVFLYFQGVGSYAEVWVNGESVGTHGGGLTTFTLNVTDAVDFEAENTVAVRAGHPSGIRDLPWVCGGCELAYGFSEGTQPFGLNRPVSVVITDPVRIAPFGVHAWNHENLHEVFLTTELNNHDDAAQTITVRNALVDASGSVVTSVESAVTLAADATETVAQEFPRLESPQLWSPEEPYLYSVVTELVASSGVIDRTETRFGIRYIEWPDLNGPTGEPLRINGEPFFINGVADYEHMLGQSHAFTEAQVDARVAQILGAGFNAFRDAHHPHNLRFNEHWDREGVLWWTQFGAHIWFDNEAFQANYKALLRDWVKERRNSPSLFVYTLQNESKIPGWFAAECAEIIRELDPTARVQRPVVTCNGGEGTDWDIPQNWSGTYGGDPFNYGNELIEQRLVGEYGAWRSLGFHSEGGFYNEAPLTEDRMAGLLEIKLGQAETVRDQIIGHFMWPFTTHQNPGRNVGSQGQQTTDGVRALDQIGPANNKGLFSIWGEPLDAYYMYRSNYADPVSDPMVYIVSHTWPDRWTDPGTKDNLRVYSNCDEVELFNGYGLRSLGVQTKGAKGTHFRWDGAAIETNLLYAEGRVNGKVVARDWITLHHLPLDPTLPALEAAFGDAADALQPLPDAHYLYRVNAGGPAYTDAAGRVWDADRVYADGDDWGSSSWAERFPNLDPRFGSKREISDPVLGTKEDALYQSYRYGRDALSYRFEVPNGDYRVELHFIEPWYGVGGGDATGWRLFDVAVNGETVLDDLDLFAEAGRAHAVRKVVPATVNDGVLEVSFPEINAGQAVISAIAVAAVEAPHGNQQAESSVILRHLERSNGSVALKTWLDTGDNAFLESNVTLADLSWELRESSWLQESSTLVGKPGELRFTLETDANVYLATPTEVGRAFLAAGWEATTFNLTLSSTPDTAWPIYRHRAVAGERLEIGPEQGLPGARFVLIQERRPPPPATSVFNFMIQGSAAAESWSPIGNLRAGQTFYTDGGPAVARFHSRLSDCDWIRTAQADAANDDVSATFLVQDHTLVYVMFDNRIEDLPDWVLEDGWVPSNGYQMQSTIDGDYAFFGWQKRFLPGEIVRLGPNGQLPDGSEARMYAAVVRSVRAAFTLQTEDLDEAKKLVDSTLPAYTGEGYADLAKLKGDMFALGFEVGVGDRYGLNIRYHSRSSEPIELAVTIRNASDGAVVCEDTYVFDPTGGEGWAILRERTCESTNAGYYWVELSGEGLHQLAIDAMEVE